MHELHSATAYQYTRLPNEVDITPRDSIVEDLSHVDSQHMNIHEKTDSQTVQLTIEPCSKHLSVQSPIDEPVPSTSAPPANSNPNFETSQSETVRVQNDQNDAVLFIAQRLAEEYSIDFPNPMLSDIDLDEILDTFSQEIPDLTPYI